MIFRITGFFVIVFGGENRRFRESERRELLYGYLELRGNFKKKMQGKPSQYIYGWQRKFFPEKLRGIDSKVFLYSVEESAHSEVRGRVNSEDRNRMKLRGENLFYETAKIT